MAELHCSINNGNHIRTSYSKCTYAFSWSMEDYSEWPIDVAVTCPEFQLEDRVFYATLPDGENDNDCFLTINLKSGSNIRIVHYFSITDCTGTVFWETIKMHTYNDSARICEFSNKDLVAYSKEAKDKVLIFKCNMEFYKFRTISGREYRLTTENMSNLVDDLKSMYATALYADVNLIVEDSVVRVHKSLLCARSPVFAKMFATPMAESEKKVVDITDFKLCVVKDFVEFLYTGNLRNDDFESVYALFYAADKYDVSGLRRTCVDVLLSKMDVDNACRVVFLAVQHSDELLKDMAMEFIQLHLDKVLETDSWDKFLEDETKLASEVMAFCSKRYKKMSEIK